MPARQKLDIFNLFATAALIERNQHQTVTVLHVVVCLLQSVIDEQIAKVWGALRLQLPTCQMES